MRNLVLALCAGGLAMAGTTPADAVGTRYPYCIQGRDIPALSQCDFTSYEQCQATASGRFLWCIENPYYNPGPAAEPRATRGRDRLPPPYPRY